MLVIEDSESPIYTLGLKVIDEEVESSCFSFSKSKIFSPSFPEYANQVAFADCIDRGESDIEREE